MQARQPEGDVHVSVAFADVIPVDEHGPAAIEAEIVATHIEVQDVFAGQRRADFSPS